MIETLGTEAGRFLITQGVLGIWALAASAFAAIEWIDIRKSAKENAATRELLADGHRKEVAEMYEKRLAEALSLLTAINKNAEVLGALGRGMDERGTLNATSLAALSQAITMLAKDFEQWKQSSAQDRVAGDSFWRERFSGLENKLADAQRRLESIQRRTGDREP